MLVVTVECRVGWRGIGLFGMGTLGKGSGIEKW